MEKVHIRKGYRNVTVYNKNRCSHNGKLHLRKIVAINSKAGRKERKKNVRT